MNGERYETTWLGCLATTCRFNEKRRCQARREPLQLSNSIMDDRSRATIRRQSEACRRREWSAENEGLTPPSSVSWPLSPLR